ncbi:hypothetical protein M408DRAFT_282220 [Serendipita vermifera MAFF 305830]|uniref:Uncharacterized protein n=1 Tax=Serendipita vermifera MAFF 305830 TaxID=933852 RepID=A0A0C2W8A9_SERVB|nr:hypothetical protein M408DRAFT_282220 [Serendipita vermifera MAFF 305830]
MHRRVQALPLKKHVFSALYRRRYTYPFSESSTLQFNSGAQDHEPTNLMPESFVIQRNELPRDQSGLVQSLPKLLEMQTDRFGLERWTV